MRHRALTLAGLILIGGLRCGGLTVVAPAVSEDFELAPHGTAAVTGTDISVRFERVVSDSRCPTDAVCVWAGSTAVDVVVTEFGIEKFRGTLNTNIEPKVVIVGGHTLEITAINPAAQSSTPIPPQNYRVRFRLSPRPG